ncbi:MAG TPA: hypothetical protein VN767_13310 [Streptosporangiaceae bacterium]|nr:hypothetical protein [Streptosporangiaceae bacterium]
MKRSFSQLVLAAGAAITVAVTFTAPAGAAGTAPAAGSSLPSGDITTVAGGYGGPGPATAVSLQQVSGCFGMQIAHGQLYLNGGGVERAIDVRNGLLKTVATQLVPNFFTGVGGPFHLLQDSPCSATVDSFGNLVAADHGLRVLAATSGTFYGQQMKAGSVYPVMQGNNCSGELTALRGLACAVDVAMDRWGNLVVSFSASVGNAHPRPAAVDVAPVRSGTFYGVRMKVGHTYRLVSGGGAQIAADRAGNLLVAGDGPNRVGVIAGKAGRFYGRAMKAGHLYDLAGTGKAGFSGDGRSAIKARLRTPRGVTVDGAGNVVIGDTGNGGVRVVAERSGRFYGLAMKAGDIYTVIGKSAPARQASPVAVAVDGKGNLLALDLPQHGFLNPVAAQVTVLASRSGLFYGRQLRAGHLYVVAGTTSGTPGDGGPATRAQFSALRGLAVDSSGNLVQTDGFWVRVVAARTGTFFGQQMTAGDVYTVAGDGSSTPSGDGGPALNAGMQPQAVTMDGSGNLVIADIGRVRVVAESTGTFYGQAMTAGNIYTVAGDGDEGPTFDGVPAVTTTVSGDGMAFDAHGNLVIADIGDQRIRVVAASAGTFYGQSMVAGDIYTVAGGGDFLSGDGLPATQANIEDPIGVTTDSNGNVVFAENFTSKLIRVVATSTGTFYGQAMTAGDIYTIAGQGGATDGLGDGGPAAMSWLKFPAGLAFDGSGNLIIADEFHGHGRVRMIAGSTGTFYGQAMTAGDIYTIAGGGNLGLNDGAPGTSAEVDPYWVAVTPDGDLAITDPGNGRIRLVTH